MRRALFVAVAAALLAVPLARANGDPASDVLLTQPVFFPFDARWLTPTARRCRRRSRPRTSAATRSGSR